MWKYFILGLTVLSTGFDLVAGTQLVETNIAGNYQIKQAAVSGEMTVKATPGMYMQNFGKITTYRIADDYDITAVSYTHLTLPTIYSV